jgi:hypothetical protein
MVIMPDQKWLEQFKSTGDKQDNNLLTTEEYNAILQNGISVVSNTDNFNNQAMSSLVKSPIEQIVDYNGFYEEKVPGAGTFRVEKGRQGTSDYITSTQLQVWDANNNRWKENIVYDNFSPKNRNLPIYREEQMNILYETSKLNDMLYNGDLDINY